jgi:hypothetical protein
MATNLVSVVMQFLTPDMIAKIAAALGLDRSLVQKAIGGAIPALLASLADVASTPNGARQLTNTLNQQSGSLENLKDLIGGSGQNSLAETGSNMLSGLFGGGTLDTMAQTIGKFAGIGEGASKSMLGTLGPLVLGALSHQQRSAGLDASGLASLLNSQKDQIAAADMKAKCIDDLRQVSALLAAKAPGDAAAFKNWLRQISQSTAEAATEGGGLFGGGVKVSDAEKATLGEISTALGV